METRKMQLALSAGALALSLALAGCGGGGSGGSPGTTSGGGGDMECPAGHTGEYPNCVDPVEGPAKTLNMLADAGKAAEMAGEEAVKKAMDYAGKLDVISVMGDSSMAKANADMVVAVRTDLADKIKAAQDAVDEAEKADDLGEEAQKALDTRIMEVEGQIAEAQKVLDGDDLKMQVEMAMKAKDGDTPAITPESIGKGVADAVSSAFGVRVPSAAEAFPAEHAPSDTVGKLVMGPSDHQGMTWAQIGGSDLMPMRIASTGTTTKAVQAKSANDMTVDDFFEDVPDSIDIADGTQISDAKYKGIEGVLFCAGDNCKVSGTAESHVAGDKLTGSWYFAPDAGDMTTYTEAEGVYTLEEPATYVRYGYWLSVASATDDTTTINRYLSGPTAATGVYAVNSGVDAFKGSSASYMGKALGMSYVTSTDSKGKEMSRESSGFTADVSLTMTFGAPASLAGMISNFMGDGTDSTWSVDLDSADVTTGTFSAGGVSGDATDGSWTATAWGGSTEAGSEARPTGVYGAFDAEFTNGAAAGVYSTRKQ